MEEPIPFGKPIVVDAETFDWLLNELDKPPRDLSKLRALFESERRFESGENTPDSGTS